MKLDLNNLVLIAPLAVDNFGTVGRVASLKFTWTRTVAMGMGCRSRVSTHTGAVIKYKSISVFVSIFVSTPWTLSRHRNHMPSIEP